MVVGAEQVGTKRIMIAEGDPALREILVQIIAEETRHHSLLVPPESQIVDAIKLNKPHLLLLDLHLPHVDIPALCDQLLHEHATISPPPLLLTSTHALKQELHYPHMAFLSKPFELEELLATIERLLIV